MTHKASPRLCARCQSQLPEGSGNCVACGHHNTDDTAISRQLTFEEDMQRKRRQTSLIDWIMYQFWGR